MEKKPDFTLIPFLEIEDNAREIAVSWVENYTPYGATLPEIAQKQKLASDIINYAKWRVKLETKSLQSQLSEAEATHQRFADTCIRLAKECEELEKSHAELRSLKQSIIESALKSYFPDKDISFHDKVVFAIHDSQSQNERLLTALKEIVSCQYDPEKSLANLNGAIRDAKQLINEIEKQ